MTDMETKLQAAVEHGGLAGFTLYATQDGRWQAATTLDRLSYRIEIDESPVVATLKALSAVVTSVVATDNDGQTSIFE
jgi:hypothetical protein